MPLLVLCAINGRTLELTVNGGTRVDKVQEALVQFTGMPVSEQIAMFKGARLDPTKTLGYYKLPVLDSQEMEDSPVFLYSRLFLKPGMPPPPIETLPAISTAVPTAPEVQLVHPLHSAQSETVRALPDLELHFQHHLLEGGTYLNASTQRLQKGKQLLSEQEVQARAADAARANVEAHYTYISNSYAKFMRMYMVQYERNQNILVSFNSDLAALGKMELHPALRTEKWRSLGDLLPTVKLQDRAEQCSRSHDHFAVKVSELEGLFNALKSDVEGLFLQAPSVDLDQLGQELSDGESRIEEQASIVQVLSKDLMTVRVVVEDIVTQLGSGSLTGSSAQDACAAMDLIRSSHVEQLLPRVRECDELALSLTQRCVAAKNRMTGELVDQLQRISAQQSKIRDMKNKLAAFSEVLTRQDSAFADLLCVSRLPAAYRFCLAECVRRRAWHHLYSGQAVKLAEHMCKLRDKELSKTETFRVQVERLIPSDLLSRAGLLIEPPHPQVSVPPVSGLLEVAVHELTGLPKLESHLEDEFHPSDVAHESDGAHPLSYPSATAPISMPALEMENSRLKAELANHIAAACMRELNPDASSGGSRGKKPGGRDQRRKEGEALPATAPSASASPSVSSGEKNGAEAASKQLPPSVRNPSTTPAGPQPPLSKAPTQSPPEAGECDGAAVAAVVALQRALRLKDDFVGKLQQENSALAARAGSYEARIAALEDRLATQSQNIEARLAASQMVADPRELHYSTAQLNQPTSSSRFADPVTSHQSHLQGPPQGHAPAPLGPPEMRRPSSLPRGSGDVQSVVSTGGMVDDMPPSIILGQPGREGGVVSGMGPGVGPPFGPSVGPIALAAMGGFRSLTSTLTSSPSQDSIRRTASQDSSADLAKPHANASRGQDPPMGAELDSSVLGRSMMVGSESLFMGATGLTDSVLLPSSQIVGPDPDTDSGQYITEEVGGSCSMHFGSLPFAPSLPSPLAAAIASGQLPASLQAAAPPMLRPSGQRGAMAGIQSAPGHSTLVSKGRAGSEGPKGASSMFQASHTSSKQKHDLSSTLSMSDTSAKQKDELSSTLSMSDTSAKQKDELSTMSMSGFSVDLKANRSITTSISDASAMRASVNTSAAHESGTSIPPVTADESGTAVPLTTIPAAPADTPPGSTNTPVAAPSKRVGGSASQGEAGGASEGLGERGEGQGGASEGVGEGGGPAGKRGRGKRAGGAEGRDTTGRKEVQAGHRGETEGGEGQAGEQGTWAGVEDGGGSGEGQEEGGEGQAEAQVGDESGENHAGVAKEGLASSVSRSEGEEREHEGGQGTHAPCECYDDDGDGNELPDIDDVMGGSGAGSMHENSEEDRCMILGGSMHCS